MTEEERAHLELALKAAWSEGFKAARHWPNHALPELVVTWHRDTASIQPLWSQRKNGWIG